MKNKKYIIMEIIPTAPDPKQGEIVQLSALKLEGLVLKDRFDYRLKSELITNQDLLKIISYDKDSFKYVDNTSKIMKKFKNWIKNYDLLIIDNQYTEKYLEDIKNKKESIFSYLNMTFSDDIIEKVMKKYKIQPSNHIVDILYEALIFESKDK